jgi:autotransporter-associated beta strand protein
MANWVPLTATDAFGTSSFAAAGNWQDGNPPSAANGYFTRTFALRSPADANAYIFAGAALSVDTGGRFIMKGTSGQVMTVTNLIINGGLVDYANGDDSFTETLAGNITLQADLTNYMGALSAGGSETLFENAPIGGSGNLQLGGSNVNNGQDTGVVVLEATNTYTGTTTVATGTLLVNGENGSSAITVNTNATLGGSGSIAGPVAVQPGGTLAPGIPSQGALTAAIGTLTMSNAATVSGTVVMKINRSANPASDQLNAPAVVVNAGASLVVNNLGSTNFLAGDTFTLFSTPISGSFSTVTLPPLPGANLYWTNNLVVNGSIAVAAAVTVNPNSTNITATVSGGTLSLSWPQDHTGWTLQVQTNSAGVGLGTNWVDVPGSTTTNAVPIPIGAANGAVFYRLKL